MSRTSVRLHRIFTGVSARPTGSLQAGGAPRKSPGLARVGLVKTSALHRRGGEQPRGRSAPTPARGAPRARLGLACEPRHGRVHAHASSPTPYARVWGPRSCVLENRRQKKLEPPPEEEPPARPQRPCRTPLEWETNFRFLLLSINLTSQLRKASILASRCQVSEANPEAQGTPPQLHAPDARGRAGTGPVCLQTLLSLPLRRKHTGQGRGNVSRPLHLPDTATPHSAPQAASGRGRGMSLERNVKTVRVVSPTARTARQLRVWGGGGGCACPSTSSFPWLRTALR